MNCRDDQQKLRRPEVNVANQPAKRDEVANGLDGLRGLIRRGNVIEHFKDARRAQYEHQEYSCSTRAKRVSPARLLSGNGRWMEVMKEGWTHKRIVSTKTLV